nr:MAG TPA: hypothetical protein [Caudoviricetes sp.]
MKSNIDYIDELLMNDLPKVTETACNADIPGEELSELAAFDVAVEEFLEHMDSLLLSKNEAYSTDEDRFYNFTVGASVIGCHKEKAAWAYAAKHIASLSKMVKDPDKHSLEEWLEKCGDLANYACLIYAMRYSKVKNEQRR